MKQKVEEFNQHEWKIEYPKVQRPYICTAFSPDKSITCRMFQCRRTEQTVAWRTELVRHMILLQCFIFSSPVIAFA